LWIKANSNENGWNTAGTLLKNLLADKLSLAAANSKVASVLTQAQIMEWIQSFLCK
jgi:hypothetical protein